MTTTDLGARVVVSRGTPLDHAIAEFAAATVRASSLDPITTEMVRLRCAQYHDCRLCGTARMDTAVNEGLDEHMVANIAHYESSDLDLRSKVALRFTDAMIMWPGALDAELRESIRAQFTDEQIAELAFDIMKWSQQKALVALRLEAPPTNALRLLSFDGDGRPVRRAPTPETTSH
jgi:AhpD family alkylhydroperoxidase